MGDSEDDVMVAALEQALALPVEPVSDLDLVTLRAAAVPARVVPDAFDVPVGTALHMAAKGRSATA